MRPGSLQLAVLLSRILGWIIIAGGVAVVLTANLLWGPIAQGFGKFSEGLSAAHDAVASVSSGVGSSSAIVSSVRQSIVTTSQVVSETRNVLTEAVYITGELREMSLLAVEDLEKLGSGLSALVGRNNFYDMAERLAAVYETSGRGILEVEQLAGTLEELEANLVEVAVAVESLESDLFSTEAAFGEANLHLERAARTADEAVSSRALLYAVDAIGLLVIMIGFYLLMLGRVLRKLSSGQP